MTLTKRAARWLALATLCLAPNVALATQQRDNPLAVAPMVGGSEVGPANPLPTTAGLSSDASVAITPVATTAAASSLVAKASAGNLYGFSGYSTVSGWFLVFNATSAPADGAVTPVDFYPYTAAQAFAVDYSGAPLRGSTGLTIVFSTTGPYTKTASATASISAKVQ